MLAVLALPHVRYKRHYYNCILITVYYPPIVCLALRTAKLTRVQADHAYTQPTTNKLK